MATINEQFIQVKTKANFESRLSSGDIKDTSIAFIEDTNEIWARGKYYPCPYTKSEIDLKLTDMTPTIGDNGNWFVGGVDSGVPSKGADGVSLGEIALVQTTGTSTESVMSQNAVTEKFSELGMRKVSKDNDTESNIKDLSSEFSILDSNGYVVLKINNKGLNVKSINICDDKGKIVSIIDLQLCKSIAQKVDKDSTGINEMKDASNEYIVSDANGNVVLRIDNEGLKTKVYNICDDFGNVLYTLNKEFLDSIIGNSLNYQSGIKKSLGDVIENSSGVTHKKTTHKVKHGSFSHFFEINNNDEENYIIIDLNGESLSGSPFGFWMWINPFDQLNVENFNAQILSNSNIVQAQIYSFGDKLYTDNGTIGTKDVKTLGGWLYLSIVGNKGTRLKLIFKSSVPTSERIASIYIDEYYYIGKKIKPVFIFNGDGFYDRQEALDVYKHIEDCGFTHSICGAYSAEEMPSLMREQIEKGVLEMGSYGGINGGNTIATSSDYSTIKNSFNEIITLSSNDEDYKVPPLLFGCQFHRLTPLIYRAAIDSGFKIVKGGSGGWYANSYQQIYDHKLHDPIVLLPTGFNGSGNNAEFLKTQAKGWIDRVIKAGTVGLVFNHNYADNPSLESDSSLFTYKEVMIYIIDYIKEKHDLGECIVLSPTEFYNYLETI